MNKIKFSYILIVQIILSISHGLPEKSSFVYKGYNETIYFDVEKIKSHGYIVADAIKPDYNEAIILRIVYVDAESIKDMYRDTVMFGDRYAIVNNEFYNRIQKDMLSEIKNHKYRKLNLMVSAYIANDKLGRESWKQTRNNGIFISIFYDAENNEARVWSKSKKINEKIKIK